jgi:hypothetical protein
MPAKSSASAAAAAAASRGTAASNRNGSAAAPNRQSAAAAAAAKEPKILFQKYFKSIGTRTYAAHVKENEKGNQFLVLTEGKRDPSSGDVKKTRVFIYSEDFAQYFRMLHETAQFIKAHPVSEEMKLKRQRYWARKEAEQAAAARIATPRISTPRAAAAPATPVRPAKVGHAKPANRRPARGR